MMQSPRRFLWLFIVGFLLAASGCATTSRTPAGFETGGDWYETGIASWYGERFQGRRTASGEPFNYHKLTAAHRSLPFGTYVEVQRVDNGRSVVVRINDRGPFVRGRIIDVSKAAAERLDMLRAGVVEVRIRIVRPAH